MNPHVDSLLTILREARELLARPGNDFSWSSWRDADHALGEVDGLIAQLQSGQLPRPLAVSILFVATGPMQETSLSSGWGQEFCDLASRFDAVEAKIWPASGPN